MAENTNPVSTTLDSTKIAETFEDKNLEEYFIQHKGFTSDDIDELKILVQRSLGDDYMAQVRLEGVRDLYLKYMELDLGKFSWVAKVLSKPDLSISS